MSPDGRKILDLLQVVADERRLRLGEPTLDACVRMVKHFQHARFARTYADLLAQPRYARAARFFLEDLYGPHDFTQRDDQFARVVPALVKLFPHEIVATVHSLAELHALSETLDTAMERVLVAPGIEAADYLRAWQRVGRQADRERQIALMLAVGSALDRLTRKPLLRNALRLMRGPARAAGLSALQDFLETGFDTFREMRGARDFLDLIASRERGLAAALFAADPVAPATALLESLGQPP
jgi:hypothetical protein